MSLLERLYNAYYINFIKKGVTYDVTNPNNEKELIVDLEFKLTNKYGDLVELGMNIEEDKITMSDKIYCPYLVDLVNNKYNLISSISGGRNKRYKLNLDYKNEIIIRTKDKNLIYFLDKMLDKEDLNYTSKDF